tara:strand:- start:3358 stop:3993 length:636 start_codon:yes stop_codon:yes gene_type:complete
LILIILLGGRVCEAEHGAGPAVVVGGATAGAVPDTAGPCDRSSSDTTANRGILCPKCPSICSETLGDCSCLSLCPASTKCSLRGGGVLGRADARVWVTHSAKDGWKPVGVLDDLKEQTSAIGDDVTNRGPLGGRVPATHHRRRGRRGDWVQRPVLCPAKHRHTAFGTILVGTTLGRHHRLVAVGAERVRVPADHDVGVLIVAHRAGVGHSC